MKDYLSFKFWSEINTFILGIGSDIHDCGELVRALNHAAYYASDKV
ncbi:hypothetical protein DSOL_3730 [Desulfosporosinus metallidurans]|uniref:Uncharacterized protein n=1 Tax=Desulfosporosinus metallidurans TaxID=1888891 RepID=A0A1Q8QNZ8_9FIRM|nr:hypothetical protein DSOL_3730 [Desulfosporosinus metallidurans]